jgi:hypothetical protein
MQARFDSINPPSIERSISSGVRQGRSHSAVPPSVKTLATNLTVSSVLFVVAEVIAGFTQTPDWITFLVLGMGLANLTLGQLIFYMECAKARDAAEAEDARSYRFSSRVDGVLTRAAAQLGTSKEEAVSRAINLLGHACDANGVELVGSDGRRRSVLLKSP